MPGKMVLCNQGCGTHIFFKDKRPYNVLDKKKHICPMLEMAKFWGGHYDTIPMGYINAQIRGSYNACSNAIQSRNIDEILKALGNTVDNLQRVVFEMDKQHTQNVEWDGKLEGYKKKLVDDQRHRDEKKQTSSSSASQFTTADKL